MADTRIARLFNNGASQAVNLPAEFRFEGEEVYATRDELTGDVILSIRPRGQTWVEFFDSVEAADAPPEAPAAPPAAKQPAAEPPTAEQPAAEQPAAEQPAAEQPAVEPPTVESSPVETPSVEPQAVAPDEKPDQTPVAE